MVTELISWEYEDRVEGPSTFRVVLAYDAPPDHTLIGTTYPLRWTLEDEGVTYAFEKPVVVEQVTLTGVNLTRVEVSGTSPVWSRLIRYRPSDPVEFRGCEWDGSTKCYSSMHAMIQAVVSRTGVPIDVTVPDCTLAETTVWSVSEDAASFLSSVLDGFGLRLTDEFRADILEGQDGLIIRQRHQAPHVGEVPLGRTVERSVSIEEALLSEELSNFSGVCVDGGNVPVLRDESRIETCVPGRQPGESDEQYDLRTRRIEIRGCQNVTTYDESNAADGSYSRRYHTVVNRPVGGSCRVNSESITEIVYKAGDPPERRHEVTSVSYSYIPEGFVSMRSESTSVQREVGGSQCGTGYRSKVEVWRYAQRDGEVFPEYQGTWEYGFDDSEWDCTAGPPPTVLRRAEHRSITHTGNQVLRRTSVYTYGQDGSLQSVRTSTEVGAGEWHSWYEVQDMSISGTRNELLRKLDALRRAGLGGDTLVDILMQQLSYLVWQRRIQKLKDTDRALSKECKPDPRSIPEGKEVVEEPVSTCGEDREGKVTYNAPLVGSAECATRLRDQVLAASGFPGRRYVKRCEATLVPVPWLRAGTRVTYAGEDWFVETVRWSWQEGGGLIQNASLVRWVS